MIEELVKLRELTETLTGNGYLRDQTEEWEYALDAIPNPIYIVNSKFMIKFVNKALSERMGVKKANFLDRICFEFIHGYPTEQFPEDWDNKDINNSVLFLKDQYIEPLSGWFDITRSPIYTRTNKLLGFICVLQDVSAKKQALDKLRWREALLKTIFDSAPICIGMLESGSRIIKAVNKTFVDLLEYSEDELVGRTTKMLYPSNEEFLRVGEEKYSKMNELGYGAIETTWITKSGKYINIYIKTCRVALSGDVVFTAVDLSKLIQDQQRIDLFVENNPLAVIGWDNTHNINIWNDSARKIFGYKSEEVLGKNISFLIPEPDRLGFINVCEDLFKQKDSSYSVHRGLTKCGRILFCEWYNSPFIDASDKVIGAVSLIMDITESKLNKERLSSALTLTTMNHQSEDEVIEYALEEAERLTGSKIGYIHFINDLSEEISINLFKWSKEVENNCSAKKTFSYPLYKAGRWADCIKTKKPVVCNNYKTLTEEEGKRGLPEGHVDITRFISIPVLVKDKVVAVAGVGNKNINYDKNDVEQLSLFMNSMWDIVQRIRAEKLSKDINNKYRLILDNMPDIIWTMDKNLNVTFVNKAIKNILGHELNFWLNNNLVDIFNKEDFEKISDSINKMCFSNTNNFLSLNSNLTNVDGNKVSLSITIKTLKTKDGEISGFQGTAKIQE